MTVMMLKRDRHQDAVDEIRRVLRPGGTVVITVDHHHGSIDDHHSIDHAGATGTLLVVLRAPDTVVRAHRHGYRPRPDPAARQRARAADVRARDDAPRPRSAR